MMSSWLLSSGMRLKFVFAMKSHLAILAMVRSVELQSRIKGVASTEEEAFYRVSQSRPGMLFCSDQLAEGNGFSLCKRAIQAVDDLRVVMVCAGETVDVALALECGVMAVVCEDDFLSPEMEVMQSLLAAANKKCFVSSRAKARMIRPALIVDSPQSLTPREAEILALMLKGFTDKDISDKLLISVYTVKEYGKSIRAKYGVKTRLQLLSSLLAGGLARRLSA